MARGPSPQLGFNTNVRHKGKVYHVQTEDSGVGRPHVITHLFVDGGRIVDSRKTDYAQHVGAANLGEIVKKLMQDQHKGMCISLRDGTYDGEPKPAAPAAAANLAAPVATAKRASLAPPAARGTGAAKAPSQPRASKPPPAGGAVGGRASRRPPAPRAPMDVAAFERAAEARIAESPIARAPKRRRKVAEPAVRAAAGAKVLAAIEPPARTPSRPIRGKTLDDVILAYLDKEGRKTGK
jgi:hypothetical protein